MFLALFLQAAVQISPAATPPVRTDDIIVEGERGRTARDRAIAFVSTVGLGANEVPAARWIERYCPKVIGLQEAQAVQVEARIREIARAIRAPLARPGCKGNAFIAFTPDAASEMRTIVKKQGGLQSNFSPAQARAMVNSTGPARWWYTSEYRSSDGAAPIDVQHPALMKGEDENGTAIALHSFGDSLPQQTSSNVSTKQKRGITGATVIIQVGPGMPPISALADYGALLSLAEIQPGATTKGSILDLFNQPQLYPTLSETDQRFLRALYRVSLDRRGHRQRQMVIGDMTKQALADSR